jgi:hypothetical protein
MLEAFMMLSAHAGLDWLWRRRKNEEWDLFPGVDSFLMLSTPGKRSREKRQEEHGIAP